MPRSRLPPREYHVGIAVVVRPTEHGLKFEHLEIRCRLVIGDADFIIQRVVAHLVSQLDQGIEVIRLLPERFERLEDGVERLHLEVDGLGSIGIVPERRAIPLLFKTRQSLQFMTQVKESLVNGQSSRSHFLHFASAPCPRPRSPTKKALDIIPSGDLPTGPVGTYTLHRFGTRRTAEPHNLASLSLMIANFATLGRLAPSPTGGLHLGHARTFLAAWLCSRSKNGGIVLRIEDLDASRVRPEATRAILDDLRWLGLNWDQGPDIGGPSAPYVQSQRMECYDNALARLRSENRIYPCTCTRADIKRLASAPHAEDEGPSYPGTCAGRSASEALSLDKQPFAWRFRVPAGSIRWHDLFLGDVEIDPSIVGGDFLVARQGIGPSYQLAVVVDDALMGVTEVIRGQDLVPSTPRQILIYQALGVPLPTFGHLPLVVDLQGRRLAKRDASIKLSMLRAQGVDPRKIITWLALSLGMSGTDGPTLADDWVGRFAVEKVPTLPFIAFINEFMDDC